MTPKHDRPSPNDPATTSALHDPAAAEVERRRAALQGGRDAEAFVASMLAAEGWSIVARNVRIGAGELDLVVLRAGRLRFVEVKARTDGDDALEAVTIDKQRKLRSAAEAWLQLADVCFDEVAFTVAVVGMQPGGFTLERIDDAF